MLRTPHERDTIDVGRAQAREDSDTEMTIRRPMVTVTGYDTMDRVTSVKVATTPSGATDPDLNLLTTYAYDAVGNRTDSTDPTGIVSHYDYDRLGNVTASTMNYVSGGAVTSSQNVKASFAYNARGELLASCAPNAVQAGCNPITPSSSAWRYSYDALGHIATETPPVNVTGTALSATTYEYDTDSGGARLTRTCDHPAAGSCANSTRYIDTAYDALARVTSVTNYTGVAGSGTEALRTEIAYDAGSQRTSLTYYEAGTQKDALTFAYDSLGRLTTLSRGGNAVTSYTYNADDTTSSRTDHAISTTASAFTYNWRGQELTASSPVYTGSTTFSWRLDGTVGARTWPTGANSATFSYDRAKRPTSLTELRSGSGQATLSRSYSRAGDVTSETQTLTGISGIAGSGTQSFTYDELHRVTGSSISGGPTQTYAYDADSNRTSWNDGTATTTFDYNETDELTGQHRSSNDRWYAYDAYGNMTSSAVALSGATCPVSSSLDGFGLK